MEEEQNRKEEQKVPHHHIELDTSIHQLNLPEM